MNQSHTELAARARKLILDASNFGFRSIEAELFLTLGACAAALESTTPPERVQGEAAWENSEGWESLAWELCADEHGEEACSELIWEGGPVPEPWGDRWLKYEDEAKRLIALVHKHVPATPPTAPAQASEGAAPEGWREAIQRLRDGVSSGSRSVSDMETEQAIAFPLLDAVEDALAALRASSPAETREPLSEVQIEVMWGEFMSGQGSGYMPDFVRAIEAAHDIVTKESST